MTDWNDNKAAISEAKLMFKCQSFSIERNDKNGGCPECIAVGNHFKSIRRPIFFVLLKFYVLRAFLGLFFSHFSLMNFGKM